MGLFPDQISEIIEVLVAEGTSSQCLYESVHALYSSSCLCGRWPLKLWVLVSCEIPTDEYTLDHSSSLVLISVEILRGSALFFYLFIH